MSLLSFWKGRTILYMLTAGISLMLGLTWFDLYGSNASMAISLCLIVYAFALLGFGLVSIFIREKEIEDGDNLSQ